jgi:tetratricopeptide (TPR) repeat protein
VARADGLNQLGAVLAKSGRAEEAIAHLRDAPDIAQHYAVREVEVQTRDNLGRTLCADGQLDEAIGQHRRALELATEIGDRYQRGRAEDGIARVYFAREQSIAAREHWERALAVLTELGSPDTRRCAGATRGPRTRCTGVVPRRHTHHNVALGSSVQRSRSSRYRLRRRPPA